MINASDGAVIISKSSIKFICPDPVSHNVDNAEISTSMSEAFRDAEMDLDNPAKFEDIALIISYLIHALQRVDWKQEYLSAASEIKDMVDEQKEKEKRSHLKVIK